MVLIRRAVLVLVLATVADASQQETVARRNATQGATKLTQPRLVAYVNCVCGFGYHKISHDAFSEDHCGADPDPAANYMLGLEQAELSPITHYVLSFLSFTDTHQIQTDQGSIWAGGGGSTTDFKLDAHLLAAMAAAQKNGKKIMLSLGGETGSRNFVEYWAAKGATSAERTATMRTEITRVIALFDEQNSVGPVKVNGIDIDIELGGGYIVDDDKYISTRDLIQAVPDDMLTAFVPQVGNGLCAPPSLDDLSGGLNPLDTLGGQCMTPAADGAPWTLASLARETTRADGSMKLDWLGVQYYNAVTAVCCGGGNTAARSAMSTAQNYKNLALGWTAVTEADMIDERSPWHKWRWWPGPWAAFEGIGADRLVLGKPGCQGCAGSNFLEMDSFEPMLESISRSLHAHKQQFGGVLFWDLCRLFGTEGKFCVGEHCQPSFGTDGGVAQGLTKLYKAMQKVG